MKQKDSQVVFPVAFIVVMVAFLSAIFFANATFSAAAGKKKSSTVARTSAVEHIEAQIKELEGALKITGAQEELWNNVTQVMRENARDMDALSKVRAENARTMNAVEQLKFHGQVTETRLEQLKKFLPPFEAFYGSMSDEQKKITDTIFRKGRDGMHKKK